MKRLLFLALVVLLCLGVGLVVSCSSGGDDDDDDDDTGGTWIDPSSGLTWQNPPSEDRMIWEDAKTYCANLSFDGHDDWRLPTISELRSLIRGCEATETGGACNVTDDCTELDCWNNPCTGCEYLEGPGSRGAYWPDGMTGENEMTGEISWYWSSAAVADSANYAWLVDFYHGGVYSYNNYGTDGARCVRP